jgi:hypothetical protein
MPNRSEGQRRARAERTYWDDQKETACGARRRDGRAWVNGSPRVGGSARSPMWGGAATPTRPICGSWRRSRVSSAPASHRILTTCASLKPVCSAARSVMNSRSQKWHQARVACLNGHTRLYSILFCHAKEFFLRAMTMTARMSRFRRAGIPVWQKIDDPTPLQMALRFRVFFACPCGCCRTWMVVRTGLDSAVTGANPLNYRGSS